MIKEKRVKVAVFQCVYCKDNPIWFEQSIQSIINQDYGFSNINYYLCVDGPVSEDLQRIIEKYSKNIYKIVVNKNNIGISKSLNKLIALLSEEKYVFRMDSDDFSLPKRFSSQIKVLEENPKIGICGTSLIEIDKDGNKQGIRTYCENNEQIIKYMYKGTAVGHPTVCFRGDCLKELGGYDETSNCNEDIELWFRAIFKNVLFYNLKEPMLLYRKSDEFYSRRSIKKAFNEFKIYWNGCNRLYGFGWRNLYSVLRLIFRFFPLRLSYLIYNGSIRKKMFTINLLLQSNLLRTFLLLFIFLFLATSAFSEKPETVKNQNIIREDNHYDNSNLKIKKSFHIYVSFKFINQPLQLEETYGLKKLNIYYHGHLIIKDSTKMYVANLAKIKEIGEYYKDKTDELVCFDIEKWKFRYNDSLNNYRSLLNFLNVVKTFREQAPETMFGFYGQFPQRKYWDPVLKARGFPSRCNEWQKLNEYIRPATEYVNVIMPSLYTFYKDRNSWVIYARENMNEAKKYNKPVYPFLWPQYHQNKSKKKPVDCEFIEYDYWKLQLETVYKYADGVIIWVPRGHVWDEEKEWWRATKEFLSKINKDKNQ